ncbi:MAG: TraR/DksA C4-type zinc finger protein [Anaerolineae bacterium]|nr:TraR/DksA C4-type zinc finger protein [Anaerolineae bacterium]
MDQIKAKLLEEREKVREELARIEEALQERGEYGLGKGDPAVYQWEFNLALREQFKEHLQEIEEALQRMEEGTYGICEECGKPIEIERLEVLPFTSLCIACAKRRQ